MDTTEIVDGATLYYFTTWNGPKNVVDLILLVVITIVENTVMVDLISVNNKGANLRFCSYLRYTVFTFFGNETFLLSFLPSSEPAEYQVIQILGL